MIETSEGRVLSGSCVVLPPAEALAFIRGGEAVTPTDTLETASFVQPLPHRKREQRFREMSSAERLATNNRAN